MVCPICRRDHPETDSQALSVLRATPRRLESITASLAPRAAVAQPMRGKWSAKEILAHLNDCEIAYGFRYRTIAAEPGSALAAFDQDSWAKELRYRNQPLEATLASFVALRRHNLALLRILPKSAWSQVSPHPEYGTLSLRELVVHLAHHDRNHTSQIERIASALGTGGRKKKRIKKRKKTVRKTGRQRGRR